MNAPNLNNELLQALLTASDDAKLEALRALRGDTPKPAPQGPLLLTVAEAADLLGMHRATVWRGIRAGRLKKVELFPGSWRLRRADIEALVAGEAR